MKVFSRAGYFEAEWFCMDKSDRYWSAHSSKWSVHNMSPPPRHPLLGRWLRSESLTLRLKCTCFSCCHGTSAQQQRSPRIKRAVQWQQMIGGQLLWWGAGGLLSGKNMAGQEAKQHESQNSPSVCGLLRNDQMRHQWDNTPSVSINTSCRAHTKRERERDWGRKREPCKPVAQSLFALKLEGDKKKRSCMQSWWWPLCASATSWG